MTSFDSDERTEPVPQLAPHEFAAGEILLRPWPVRLGPLEFDRLRDFEEQQRRLDEAWSRLEEAKAAARTEGYSQGREQALAENGQRLIGQLERHDEELRRMKRDLVSRLPGLASRLAARMLRHELASAPEVFSDWVLRLLEEVMPVESVTLIHHPDEENRFSGLALRAGQAFGQVRFQLRGDDRVAPGEVILETPGLRIDARSQALASVWEREIEQVLHESHPG